MLHQVVRRFDSELLALLLLSLIQPKKHSVPSTKRSDAVITKETTENQTGGTSKPEERSPPTPNRARLHPLEAATSKIEDVDQSASPTPEKRCPRSSPKKRAKAKNSADNPISKETQRRLNNVQFHFAQISSQYRLHFNAIEESFGKEARDKIDDLLNLRDAETLTPLLLAAKLFDVVDKILVLDVLIYFSKDLNQQEEKEKKSFAHFMPACYGLKYFFDTDIDLNVKDIYQNTPLHNAVLSRQWSDVTSLALHPSVSVSTIGYQGQPPLHAALQILVSTLPNFAKDFIEMYPVPDSLLLIWKHSEKERIMEALLAITNKHNMALQGRFGMTALHWIIPLLGSDFHNYAVDVLSKVKIEHLEITDAQGDTPCRKLIRCGVFPWSAKLAPSTVVSVWEDRLLLKVSVLTANTITNGETSLMIAMRRGFPARYLLALQHQQSPETSRYQNPQTGATGLHYYIHYTKTASFKEERKLNILLMQNFLKGADIGLCDNNGIPAFYEATVVAGFNPFVLLAFLQHGYDQDITFQHPVTKDTPLHLLANNLPPTLLTYTPTPEGPWNNTPEKPLQTILDLIHLLLLRGANPTVRNSLGLSCLDMHPVIGQIRKSLSTDWSDGTEPKEEPLSLAESASPRTEKKRGRTGYNLYCAEQRPILKAENPNIKGMEITKKLAANWKALSPFERNQFDNQSKVKNLSNPMGDSPRETASPRQPSSLLDKSK